MSVRRDASTALGDAASFSDAPVPVLDAGFSCSALPAEPRHLYAFEDVGTTVTDSIGGADGVVIGTATQDGSGLFNLDALGYVDLPNGLVSSLPHLTVAVWFEWDGGAAFQRVFDFGETTLGEDPDPEASFRGVSYVAFTPSFNSGQITYLMQSETMGEVSWDPTDAELIRTVQDEPHFAAVVFESGQRVSLYLDGAIIATSPTTVPLSDINDVNVWLGRSQYDSDNPFNGVYDELRIYDVPLCESALNQLYADGPNPNPTG